MVVNAVASVCFVCSLVAFVTVQAAMAVAGAAALGASKILTYFNYDGANTVNFGCFNQLLW
jgi:hypothetical protein